MTASDDASPAIISTEEADEGTVSTEGVCCLEAPGPAT